jgi:small subunit ribosomal protein S8
MITDPFTDFLNRIKNAQAVFKETVFVPFSKRKLEILAILEKKGYISKFEIKNRGRKRMINVFLKYNEEDKSPAISGFRRISKPGQRIYSGWRDLKKIKGGRGIAFISTSRGIMTDEEARKRRLGGEVLFQIW